MQSLRTACRTLQISLALLAALNASGGGLRLAQAAAGEEPPRYNPSELKKIKFKGLKGAKELSKRDKFIAEAKKNLKTTDFDKFMSDVTSLEDKVRRGKAKHRDTAIDGDDVPLEVEFDGAGDTPGVQKTSEFFGRPVQD